MKRTLPFNCQILLSLSSCLWCISHFHHFSNMNTRFCSRWAWLVATKNKIIIIGIFCYASTMSTEWLRSGIWWIVTISLCRSVNGDIRRINQLEIFWQLPEHNSLVTAEGMRTHKLMFESQRMRTNWTRRDRPLSNAASLYWSQDYMTATHRATLQRKHDIICSFDWVTM
jgi:hypothetical protein